MQEAAAVQKAMAAWRIKLDKVQATARLSATMTMAIVRKRMVWRMHAFDSEEDLITSHVPEAHSA